MKLCCATHHNGKSMPSRQVRVLPGLGKVHIVHSYDRIVPYVGHKRLTVVTSPPKVWSTTPSVLNRQYDWIENKLRPWVSYSATNDYLNSRSAVRIYYRPYPISTASSWYYDYDYRPSTYRYYSPYFSLSDFWPFYNRYSRYFSKYLPTSSYLALDDYYRYLKRTRPLSCNYWPSYSYRPLSWYGSDWPTHSSLRSYIDYWPVSRPLGYYSSYCNYSPSYYYSSYYSNPTYYSTLFDDYYRNLKRSRIVYNRYPIGTSTTCSCMMYPSYLPSYTNYYRIFRPSSLYNDYWPLVRNYSWYYRYYSPYWPIYRPYHYYHYPTTSNLWPRLRYLSYIDDYPAYRAIKLQRIFDDETRMIKAQSAALLRKIHEPVHRLPRSWPITSVRYGYEDLGSYPVRWSNDNYIHKMMTVSPSNKVEYMTYYTEPVRKYFGQGHLACVSYAGDKAHSRRRNVWNYEDPVKNDIQLLSYYIAKFRQDKAQGPRETAKVPLPSHRPTRRFTAASKLLDDPEAKEMAELREARAQRLARIYAAEDVPATPSTTVDEAVRAKKKQEELRLAEEKALAAEQAKKESQAKKDEAARKAELARQEELAAQAAAEKAAELERQAELARQEELAKQAEIERLRAEEEAKAREEEERRREEEARAEEERQQLLRLEEIARQAEEEREADLARQAEELAELARQEAELAEQAKRQAEEEELARQQAELEELERQEAELAELERKERELQEAANEQAELAEKAKEEAGVARREAEEAELARQEEELAELERQQAELDALEAEAKALETDAADMPTEEDGLEAEEDAPVEDAPVEDNGEVSADEAEQEATIEETLPGEAEEIVEEEEE